MATPRTKPRIYQTLSHQMSILLRRIYFLDKVRLCYRVRALEGCTTILHQYPALTPLRNFHQTYYRTTKTQDRQPSLPKGTPKEASIMSTEPQSPNSPPDFPSHLDPKQLSILRAHPHLYPPASTVITDLNTYGLCIGSGWYPLVSWLSAELEAVIVKLPNPQQYHAVQVKEKFGGLRFYMGRMTDEIGALINEAKEEAWRTCEGCGKPGELCDRSGWLRTTCGDDECRVGAVPTDSS